MPSGPSGDLGKLAGLQIPDLASIELAPGGEGDGINIHVKAHANGIGRNEVIHLTALIEVGLGISGARR